MIRSDLLKNPAFWVTKIQMELYGCAEKFMQKTRRNRTQMAEYLGVSKGYVTQLLSGDYNYSLEKLVELSVKLGYVPQIEFKPIEQVIQEDEFVYSNTITICSEDWATIRNHDRKAILKIPA